MADVAVEAQVNAVKVLASVAGTNTITGSMTPDLAAYSAGMIVVFTPANTNTGAVTLNIDSLGALDIFKADGDALVSGDLVVGIPALLVLDSGADDWILLNPQSANLINGTAISSLLARTASTFAGTLTGFSANPTGTVNYTVHGTLATLFTTAAITGTSNATTMTMTGLPSAVQPTNPKSVYCAGLEDNGTVYSPDVGGPGMAFVSGSTITFSQLNGSGDPVAARVFTSSATKGLRAGWTVTYELG